MGISCRSVAIAVSALDGWRIALDAVAQIVFRLPGAFQTSRALGSVSNPVYALCSNLHPSVNQSESDTRISSCTNPLNRLSVLEGGVKPIKYPGGIAELLTRYPRPHTTS